MFEGPWTITTAYVSIAILVGTVAILGITIYESFIVPGLARRKRFRDLTHPAEVYFLIQSKNMKRPIDSEIRPIAIRDDRVHKLKEIVLQSNSEYLLEILVEPITNFRTWATIFGCDEMKTAQKSRNRPRPVEFRNPFIVEGVSKLGIPNVHVGHSLNHHDQYQYDRNMEWAVGTPTAWGYKIITRGQGVFPMVMLFEGAEIEGRAELTIRVEDTAPIMMMTCASKDHEVHKIRPAFAAR
jgi:hypothetical protein